MMIILICEMAHAIDGKLKLARHILNEQSGGKAHAINGKLI